MIIGPRVYIRWCPFCKTFTTQAEIEYNAALDETTYVCRGCEKRNKE